MIRSLALLFACILPAACGQADSDGFLSDHNLCNADTSAFVDAPVAGESEKPLTAVDADGAATIGHRMANFTKNADLWGIGVRLSADQELTDDLEVEIWAKIDRELAYGQTISTVTPDNEQGVILAKAFVTKEMLPPGELAWLQVPFEEMTSVFESGRYWLMYKPAGADKAAFSVAPGAGGVASYSPGTMAWTISTTETGSYQVIPCQ